ncbi:MAG: MgtC/SapB family protein [Enterococcus sp.]
MVDLVLTIPEIMIRLSLALLVAGIIGFEREYKNHPAGIRTHILVCLGACIIALIQTEVYGMAIQDVLANPKLENTIRIDEARLIAQVVSGVGFLGAGTIIVTKQSVTGLTTAASIWSVAALGIAIGMGYYLIGILGFLSILLSLTVVKKIVRFPEVKKLEILYRHQASTKDFLAEYFQSKKIPIDDFHFEVTFHDDYRIYKNIYTFELPQGMTYASMIEELAVNTNILKITLLPAY